MATRQVTTLRVIELPVADGNWDTTRKPIDRVIIHTMVGTTASAASRFNTKNQAAAHYGVSLDGSIVHWVDENNTAYHAGDYPMNQRSIGIEHEDNGDYNGPRTDALYTTSANLVKDICQFYNIPIDRDHIKKHNEVSDNPTGCPDALDIDRIVREASGTINPPIEDEMNFTDQTPIPLNITSDQDPYEQYGELQLGTLKSKLIAKDQALDDYKRGQGIQNGMIEDLTRKLETCQAKSNVVTYPIPAPVPSSSSNIFTQLGDFFSRLWKK